MDAFISRKRRKIPGEAESHKSQNLSPSVVGQDDEQSTDEKLAILSSIFESEHHDGLLDALVHSEGSVEVAVDWLLNYSGKDQQRSKGTATNGIQSSLTFGRKQSTTGHEAGAVVHKLAKRPPTKKGRTLYLYSPSDIAHNTPCSIIHNFLPADLANQLLQELLPETTSYTSATFRLFDNVVKSPHTASFYVDSLANAQYQKSEYLYNGSTLSDVREILPTMRKVSQLVQEAVNNEIQNRIKQFYPNGKKLQYQHPGPWLPNAAFVNCYDGPQQSVGYHTDQLSYLGPHPVIGSLSLGVQREFRIRRIVPRFEVDESDPVAAQKARDEAADAQGQISLPLPHNSLLVMHAEMQETWKHSIAPAPQSNITPHPIAGRKRINITYRHYREEFAPKYTPKCKCGVPCVLKSVMRQKENHGRYVWMCQTPGRVVVDEQTNTNDTKGCGHFVWAEFDDDGAPIKKEK